MTTYTSVFGSETIPPSRNGYSAVALTADTTFYWPELASGSNLMADIMEVTPTAAWTMTFPAANGVSTGRDVLVRNLGSFTITIHDNAGGTIGTVAAGVAKYLYITNNSTAAGSWTVFTFGTGTSAADAATLAGYGIVATGSTLSQQALTISSAVTTTVTTSQRAETLIFTNSGVVTCNMPLASSAGNGFFINISNQGTGTVTIDPSGAETIDGATTKDLAPGESLTAVCSGTEWASIGYGRSTQFQFTKLVLDISAGSPFTLTSVQAQNKLIQTIGTITAGVTINVPAVVAVYYVECSHTGAFTTTIKTAAGTGINLTAGDRSILYCDGVNVVQAQTATAPAANLSGGVAGALVYQSAVGVTGFSAAGTTGNVAISGGTGSPTWSDLGLITHAYSAKTPIVNADEFPLADSAAAYGPKRTLWSTIKSSMKTYTDTLYALVGLATSSGLTMGTARLLGRTTAATGAVEEITVGSGLTLSSGTLSGSSEQSLTGFYYPAAGSAFQDLYRSGWLPSWFNQQWGGSQWGTLPDGSFGSVATGNVQDDYTGYSVGFNTTQFQAAASFYVSEAMTSPTVWLKLYKVANPTDNIVVGIYSDTSDKPNALIGSTATISAKVITSKTDGEWYSVTPTPGALSANTRYWVVVSRSGAVDSTNYFQWRYTLSNKNPNCHSSSSNNVPTWTTNSAHCGCFLIQNPAANSLIQSGGQFDYKLAFNPGSPVNQSRSVAQPLANFYDGKNCSVLHRGTYAVSTNVWDFSYGIDHDRITLTINSSGYPVLTVYRSDRTAATVTGTGSVTSGFHDVGIRVRTVGDGADYATLYVDGASVGTPLTAQTFTMDVNMALLGTARLGDGFGLAPTWTQDMQMTSLPSAQGWTWTGTGTEANCMSVSGGKLYQNANGYTSTQTGYYQKTIGAVNGTGTTVVAKLRAPTSPNNAATTIGSTPIFFQLQDGSKDVKVSLEEYFLRTGSGATTDFTIQGDFKSQDHVFVLCAKGSDYYLFMDGKLLVDGTGKFTSATANNQVLFGDGSATASDNADAIWSYVKYYQGGMILPTANTGTCSEFAHWSGDKSALFSSLYNSGTPVSVKQLCGVPRNYQYEQVVQKLNLRGVTANPTTSSTSLGVLTDMEGYVVGGSVKGITLDTLLNSTAGSQSILAPTIDGVSAPEQIYTSSSINYPTIASTNIDKTIPLGLHKIEQKWRCSANTSTSNATARQFAIEARS